ncbi:low temperature requirement protein A [Deinococcus sp.]|uniref:low temperature requirement protein A n=1 Tax=Deinococcus sp. TaxID=47478 RepID=UPI003C79D3F7
MTLAPELTPGSRVSTLELFFDLVFVFTVTQVTGGVAQAHGPTGYGQAALILGVLWWMYGGYAWLTNNVGTDSPLNRLLLLGGMFGFLVAALTIPSAFGAGGLAFGLAYLLVTLIHAALFTHAQNSSALAILRIAPFNLTGALLVILAGILGGPYRLPLWGLAFLLPVASTLFRRYGAFSLSPGHFVERHGLVLIIALGESVVSIGVGAAGLPISARLVLASGLALALVAALWWSYFGGGGGTSDESRAEHALGRASGEERARMALFAFGYAYLAILAGVVLASAGVKGVIAHLEGHASPQVAWTLAGGAALYLLGESWFRQILGIGRGRGRLLGALLALPTALIGLSMGGLWQLLALVLLLLATLLWERRAATGIGGGA